MALIDLQETDNGTGLCAINAFCSGNSNNAAGTSRREATQGGTAGSGADSVTMDNNAADLNTVWFECVIPSGASWDAGDWTTRINITTGNHQLTLDEIHICRVNSSCVSQASIGSSVGIGQNISSAQVYTFVISGAAQSPSAGDLVHIIYAFDNGQNMPQAFTFSPSEIINTPFDDGAAGAAPGLRTLAMLGAGI